MKRFLLISAVVGVLLALIAYSKWNPPQHRVSGLIEAAEIRLGSRLGGRISAVHVEEGQWVTAGTVLVELDPYDLLEREREFELTLSARESDFQRLVAGFRDEEKAQAKARLEQLRARLDLLKAGPRKQEIEAARGRLILAEAEKKLAEQSFERLTKLAKSDATSQQEFDASQEAFEAASANVLVRQQEYELLAAGTREEEIREAAASVEEAWQGWQLMEHGYRREEIEQARASRDAAQAALSAIRQQKQELSIKSPIDGSIEALDLRPGDMVAPGAPVLSMLDREKLWVRAYIPQNRFGIQIGQQLPISVDSYPDRRFSGVVMFVARQAEFIPSNVQTFEERSKQVFRIKVGISDERDVLRPGMMADVWINEVGARQ